MKFIKGEECPADKILWRQDGAWGAKLSDGGFTIDSSNLEDDWLPKGTLMSADYNTREGVIINTALVIAGGTTAAPHVTKGTQFNAGDFVFITTGAIAVTIDSVDRTNEDYDILTLSAALTGATAGAVIVQGAADGATEGAFIATPNGFVNDHTPTQGQPTVTMAETAFDIREANLPYPVNDEIKEALGVLFKFV